MMRSNAHHMGMRTKTKISNTIIYIVLVIMMLIWLIPFVCILLESFRIESTGKVGYVIPKVWGFDNYISLWTKTDFPTWYLNTLIIGLVVAVVQMAFVLCTSYTLSRMRFKGRKGLMNFILVLGMFPGFITMIVLYKVLSGVGLTNENAIFGLMLVFTASSGMGYYVSKGFFDTIPKSLDEAARVDGATRLQVLTKVTLPMSKPIVIYTILTAFMAPWGDFMFARYISHLTSKGMTVAVGLQSWLNTELMTNAYYTRFCAGGVMVAIPITLLFMFLQKYYVEGVTGGAVKG
ncbi:MAG: sugar ABC transporter permease [Eubacteriales bacterium]|nr:sugar ABC transporter permease [Eubacteriales bacterium]